MFAGKRRRQTCGSAAGLFARNWAMYRRPSRPGRRATVDRTERPFDRSLRFAASCLPANQRMEPPEPDVFPSARSLGRRLIRTFGTMKRLWSVIAFACLAAAIWQSVEVAGRVAHGATIAWKTGVGPGLISAGTTMLFRFFGDTVIFVS